MNLGAKAARASLCCAVLLGWCLVSSRAAADVSLRVWPTALEMTVSEGQIAERVVYVENAGDEWVHLRVYALDYTMDMDGTYHFLEPGGQTYSCATWVNLDAAAFDLAPGETRAVSLSIRVPAHVEPGEHYSAVFFEQSTQAGQGTSVSVGARVASLLYVVVPAVTDAEVMANADIVRVILPGLIGGGPLKAGVLVRNSGNVHLTVAARAYFTDFRGSQVGETDLGQAVILPGGERILEVVWDDVPWFGRVKARVVIGYYNNQGELVNKENSANFQVIPWKVIMAVALPLCLIGLAAFVVARRFRFRLFLERRVRP